MSADRLELLKFQLPEAFSTQEQKDIFTRITLLEQLPTFEETQTFIRNLGISQIPHPYSFDRAHPSPVTFENLCSWVRIYFVPTVEFVDALASEIEALNIKGPIIEVGAGHGKLSYHLRKRGIDVQPTDRAAREPHVDLVESIGAVEKYDPELVIAAWVDDVSTIRPLMDDKFRWIKRNNIRYLINIGEDGKSPDVHMVEGNYEAFFERTHLKLEGSSQYSIGWRDRFVPSYPYRKRNPGVMIRTTEANLFPREIPQQQLSSPVQVRDLDVAASQQL